MVRTNMVRMAAGLVGILAVAGCQHQKHNSCCPCSCSTPAQPAVATPVTIQPQTLTSVPVAPAVRSTIIGGPLRTD